MRPRFPRLLLCCLTAASLGCTSQGQPDAGGPVCDYPFAGDRNAAPEFIITAMGVGNVVTALTEGARVPLMYPPQGGRVAFIGVRARNVDPCTVELTAGLRDPATGQVRFDTRSINLRPTTNGYVESPPGAISAWANVPMCPNQWAGRDVMEQPFQLTLTAKQRNNGPEFTRTFNVTPYCAESELQADCECICRQNYMLGMSCSVDGGPDSGDAGSQRDGGV